MRSHGNLPGFLCLRRKDSKEKNALDWNATSLGLGIYPPSAIIMDGLGLSLMGTWRFRPSGWGGTRDQEHVTESSPCPDLWPCSEGLLSELPRVSPTGVACMGMDGVPARLWLQPHEGWRAQLLSPAVKGQPSGHQGGVQPRMRERKTSVQTCGVSDLLGKTDHLPIKEMPSSLPLPAQEFSNLKKKSLCILALQCCVSFCCMTMWISYTNTYIPSLMDRPPPPFRPFRSSQSTELSSLCCVAPSH